MDSTADQLCGLLAEPPRLRVYAAVVLGATTAAQVRQATGLPERDVVAALRRLVRGGLLAEGDGGLVADEAAFKQAVRDTDRDRDQAEPLDPDPARDAVLRRFFRDGRLTQLPVAWRKRRVVLEYLATAFEPGVKYREREVNAVLRAWHSDHATLRRYLVDEELLARQDGVYWRVGGPVRT